MQDALPLLEKAGRTILYIAAGAHIPGDDPGAGMALHLARHGVKVEISHDEEATGTAGEMILAKAEKIGADVIVMGGFHHSRLREMVIGGVTRTVLETAEIPGFLAH